jgi:hypothetical protein
MAVINFPLTPGEFNSLWQISLPVGRVVANSHKVRLHDLGYIVQKVGGWTLTPLGQERLALGK